MIRVSWPTNAADAVRVQQELATRVYLPVDDIEPPATVAGLDVSYSRYSDQLAAAAVVVEAGSGRILDHSVVDGVALFPYIPGLLAFREAPALLNALERVQPRPDLILCDGYGIAHPRRFGVACHVGVLTGLPTIGCAKSGFVGEHEEPGLRRGDRTPLHAGGHLVGYVLRTQDGVKPIYVSPGSGISLRQSCDVVLDQCSNYRVPDPIRHADHFSRQALRGS
jgi:deoxyribonuclease V